MSEGIVTRRASDIRPLLLDRFRNAAAAYSLRPLTLSGQDNPVVKVRRSVDDTEQDFNPAQINDGTLEQFVNAGDVAPADYGTGAAAAYSLRHVSDGYTGDVVRVRESTNNTEQDFNPTEILDGTLLAFCGAGDGLVTTIYDQSGNGNNYTQPTASEQGVLVSSGSLNLLNGKPVILRSANDNGGYLSTYAPNDGADPKLYFYVGKVGNNNACIFGSRTGGGDYGYISQSGSTSTIVNSAVVPANEKLNNQALSYTTRDEFYQKTINQFLLSADITFNFNNNEKALGYRFDNTSTLGMFAFQEEIIYLNDASINRELIETNVNHYYSIYSQTNDGFVTTWYDQSGNGNHATQATAASQPKIVSAGSLVVENGKAALDFDADFLEVPSSQATFNFLHDGTSSSVFLTATAGKVANPNALYSYFGNNLASSSSTGIMIGYDDRISDALYISISKGIAGQGVVFERPSNTVIAQQQNVIYVAIDADNITPSDRYKAATNGGSLFGNNGQTNAPVTTDASNNLQIGSLGNGGSALVGYYQELVIYDTSQSTKRQQIESNLNTYYGIY